MPRSSRPPADATARLSKYATVSRAAGEFLIRCGAVSSARRVIPLSDTADEPWVDIRCEVGCCRAATTTAFQQAGFTPHRVVEADEYWPAQGFVAAQLGLALIPALTLGVLHDGVAVRRLQRTSQPERHVLAVTRPAIASTAPVQAMLTALETQASTRRHTSPQPTFPAR